MFDIASILKLLGQGAGAGAGAMGGGTNPVSGMLASAAPQAPGGGAGMLGAPTPMAPPAPAPTAAATPGGGFGGIMDKLGGGQNVGSYLMDMGAGMMAGGAPSLDPGSSSFLGAMGKGMGQANAGASGRRDQDMKSKLIDAQVGGYSAEADKTRMQMDAIKQGAPSTPQFANPNAQQAPAGAGVGAVQSMPLPSLGEVVDGHRFIGGNPASPASWEPVA